MTDPNRTALIFVADRTGSMTFKVDQSSTTRAQLTTRGIHDMVKDQQKEPGSLLVSLVDFDDVEIRDVENLGDGSKTLAWSCQPWGNTPLWDAVGRTIVRTGERLALMNEEHRPGKVVVVIGTDGLENASTEYTQQQVQEMVKHQQDA